MHGRNHRMCVCGHPEEKTNDGKKGKTIQNRSWLFWTQSFLALFSTAYRLETTYWMTTGSGEAPAFYSPSGFSKQFLLGHHPISTEESSFLCHKFGFHFRVLAFIYPLSVNVGFIYPFWIQCIPEPALLLQNSWGKHREMEDKES